jgi:F0F1-type ATP synthase assembly protein I
MIKQKGKEWLKRYLPSEIVGTVTAMAAAAITNTISKNPIVIAYSAALGESIGFYSTVLLRDILRANKKQKLKNKTIDFREFIKIITTIILEFGPAGLIDGLLLRPFFMYLFPILLGNFMFGIFIGKITGDITFYFFVIVSYEINKRRKINREHFEK